MTGRIEKERSYELILLYPAGQAAASDRRIEEIRRAYEKTFGQESVGRVDDTGPAPTSDVPGRSGPALARKNYRR